MLRQHFVATSLLLAATWSWLGSAAEQVTAPDSATKPMLTRPGMTLAPSQPTALPSCIKQIWDASTNLTPQPVPAAQYFAIAAATMIVRPPLNSGQVEFGLSQAEPFPGGELEWAFVPLNLPRGATIREIVATVYDSSGVENLQLTLSKRMRDQPRPSARLLTLESDCAPLGIFTTMGAANLAIPFDDKFAHVLKVSAVPAKTPVGVVGVTPGSLSFQEVRVGYTLQ
jgi:hypothetical protein